MKVKAKFQSGKFGFINGRRVYDGEVIEIRPSQFSEKWMEKISKRGPKPKEETNADFDYSTEPEIGSV